MKIRRGVGVAVLGAGLVVLSCSADRGSVPSARDADASVSTATGGMLLDSRAAVTRIAELRARFRALGAPVATRFDAGTAASVRAVLPHAALRGVTRAAHVALPLVATGDVTLEDDTSHVSVRFALEHVQDADIEVAGGMAIYRGALAGADVVHRVHAEGTEDFVVFETRPAREELSYSVDVSRVAGLRLVSNTLEFLDESGTPVLRVAPPYVVDAKGERHEAKLAVHGCAYDTSPAGPWGRNVTRPGAARCTVRVAWAGGIAYPAMVDPAWVATGSMAAARSHHTASLLPSGKVLVAGGYNGSVDLASAELYDPAGNAGAGTFAATGAMATARSYHGASVLPSGKVLVTAGGNANGLLASAELYDPSGNAGAGSFAATGPMAIARQEHTASVLPSGKVLVVGGVASVALASAELYDPSGNAGAGSFVATGPMAIARTSHTVSVLPSGKVLVAGGINDVSPYYLASAELYDPSGNAGAGTFAASGSMATARSSHTASVLPSGKVLVAGGYYGNGLQLASAELFDPAGNAGAGAFAATGSMAAPRVDHTASVLPSGKVLVTGPAVGTELFDPAGNAGAGTFAASGSTVSARSFHTASVLLSGKVLIAGGAQVLVPVASAELFSLAATGVTCAVGGECLSGLCADGFCCASACSGGGCDRCDLPGKEGTCSVAPAGNPGANAACAFSLVCDGVNAACPTSCASDATCAASFYCAATGTCEPRKAQAVACNDCKEPGCRACASGFCVDGVCCDKACTGQCEACDSFAGTCGPIAGKPHGSRAACPVGNECSVATSKCDVPPGSATCDGDHTTTGTDGTKQDCSPYKCDSTGACRQPICASVNDCVAPTICDPSGKCVPPAVTGSDGGCAISAAGSGTGDDSSRFAWLTTAFGLVLLRLRRRSVVRVALE